MTRTGEEAIAVARRESSDGTRFDVGLCLQRVRLCYGVAALYGDATTAWLRAGHKHPTTDPAAIPRGVPIFWTGGSSGHGHVAISAGNGECWSTDILRRGRWDKVPIRLIGTTWGLRLVGWTEDLNGVRVFAAGNTDGKEVDMTPEELMHSKIKAAGDRYVSVVLAQTWARTARLEAAVTALATSMGPTVKDAVEKALADAVVDVDVTVNQTGGGA
jgi:hypothetical protein